MKGSDWMLRFQCPCCYYPTLHEEDGDEICYLCGWQDDGQDDPYADEVWGGPNKDYSLTEARENFKKNYTQYRDKIHILGQSDKVIMTKKALIIEFKKLKTMSDNSTKQLWKQIASLEQVLEDIMHEASEHYRKNVNRNKKTIKLIYSDAPDKIIKGLLDLVLKADDKEFLQDFMVKYSQHKDENIRGTVIRCFGHIAKKYNTITNKLVLPLINDALNDESNFVKECAHLALDDIKLYCK
jgi:hypothetical protein